MTLVVMWARKGLFEGDHVTAIRHRRVWDQMMSCDGLASGWMGLSPGVALSSLFWRRLIGFPGEEKLLVGWIAGEDVGIMMLAIMSWVDWERL